MSAVTNAVGLFLGGSPVEGVVAGAASPYINTQIKEATKGNPTANTVAHSVWGAVEAQLQGGNAAAGATAAATAELGAQYLAEKLYGTTNPEKLTEAQKQTVSELSQTAAGLAAGLTAGASGANSATISKEANAGQSIGKNAVENNGLKSVLKYTDEALVGCAKNPRCHQVLENLGINSVVGLSPEARNDAVDVLASARSNPEAIKNLSPEQVGFLASQITAGKGLFTSSDLELLYKYSPYLNKNNIGEIVGDGYLVHPEKEVAKPTTLDTPISESNKDNTLSTPIADNTFGSGIIYTPISTQNNNLILDGESQVESSSNDSGIIFAKSEDKKGSR